MEQGGDREPALVALLVAGPSPGWLARAKERIAELEFAPVRSAAECHALARTRPLDAAIIDARIGAEA